MSGLFDRIGAKALGAEVAAEGQGAALLQPVSVGVFGEESITWLEEDVTPPARPERDVPSARPEPEPAPPLEAPDLDTPARIQPVYHETTQRFERTQVHHNRIIERHDLPRDTPENQSPAPSGHVVPRQSPPTDRTPAPGKTTTHHAENPVKPKPVVQLQPVAPSPAPKGPDVTTHAQQARERAAPPASSPNVHLRIGAITVKAAPPPQAPSPPAPAAPPFASAPPSTARAAGANLTSYLGWRR